MHFRLMYFNINSHYFHSGRNNRAVRCLRYKMPTPWPASACRRESPVPVCTVLEQSLKACGSGWGGVSSSLNEQYTWVHVIASVFFVHIVFTHLKMFPELYLIAGNADFSWVTNQLSVYDTRQQRHLGFYAYPVSGKKSIIHHLIVFKYWSKILSTIGKLLWRGNRVLASSKATFLKSRSVNLVLLICSASELPMLLPQHSSWWDWDFSTGSLREPQWGKKSKPKPYLYILTGVLKFDYILDKYSFFLVYVKTSLKDIILCRKEQGLFQGKYFLQAPYGFPPKSPKV